MARPEDEQREAVTLRREKNDGPGSGSPAVGFAGDRDGRLQRDPMTRFRSPRAQHDCGFGRSLPGA